MKPGNLVEAKVPNPAAKREMRIRYTHIGSVGVRFFYALPPFGGGGSPQG